MLEAIATLSKRLAQIQDPAPDNRLLLEEWLSKPLSLTPWEVWTLLCLVRHRERQQFVADAITYRLDGDLEILAKAGAQGHPDGPQQGVVPGMLDWEFYFHGIGCCLTHRTTGESIDVDFQDSSADWFDQFFLTNYLESLKAPSFVEKRVIALHPSFNAVRLTMDDLLEKGLLEQHEYPSTVRLKFDHEPIVKLINEIEQEWDRQEKQLMVAAAMGDWFHLDQLVPEGHRTQVKDSLSACCEQRTTHLIDHFRSGSNQADALDALHDLDSPALPSVLREALIGKPSHTIYSALLVIGKLDDPMWCDDLESLLKRVNPNGENTEPYVWHSCAYFLLRHGRASNIKAQLQRTTSSCLGDASILTLEYFPDIAIETFRRSLRSEVPCNRITSAAALAIIDQPWSRKELLAVIAESDDHMMTTECRSALLTTHSEESHRKVVEWEKQNPREPEQGEFITMNEMVLRQSDGTIHWEMEKLHDRVMKLRNREPDTL